MAETTKPTADQLRETIEAAAPHVAALVAIQAAYDADGFRIAPPRQPLAYKVRHMTYHLRKALQRIDDRAERWEHQEYDSELGAPADGDVTEAIKADGLVAAELFFGALQLAEIGGFDLAGAWSDMLARNAKVFIPESGFAELEQQTFTEPLNKVLP